MYIQLDKVTAEMLIAIMKRHRHHDAKKFISEQIGKMYYALQGSK